MDGEWVGMSLLGQLTCHSRRPSKNHVGGESNFLMEKSKFHEKVYVSKLFDIPDFFHYKYMITILFFLLEA